MGNYIWPAKEYPSIKKFTFMEKKGSNLNDNKVELSSDSAADYLDVVFCIDTTGSMSSYIEKSKKVISNMIEYFQLNDEKPLFGVVAYRDHPPQDSSYITKIQNLSDAENALSFVKSLQASGGGDTCEAVLQGLYDSVDKIKWRNLDVPNKTYKKLLIHVADAPPHGKQFHAEGADDHWPAGCPSGITLEKLAASMNNNSIFYHFCRLNDITDLMCERFYQTFKNFELLDLTVNEGNIKEQAKEFEAYVAEHHVESYKSMKLDMMSMEKQNECLYEAKVTNLLSKNMKRKV